MVSLVQVRSRRHRNFSCRQTISIVFCAGTIGGQAEQDSFVIDYPPIPCRFVDAVMDAGVIQDNNGRRAIVHVEQIVDEVHDVRVFDAAGRGG